MTTKTAVEEVIARQIAAWNRHDAAELAAGYTVDTTVLDPYYTEPLSGRDAVAKDAASFFVGFPDISFRITKTLSSGNTAAYEGMASATHTGPLELPSGVVPATNKRLEFSFAGFIELDEAGKIREERRYYDVAGQLTQLGLMQ